MKTNVLMDNSSTSGLKENSDANYGTINELGKRKSSQVCHFEVESQSQKKSRGVNNSTKKFTHGNYNRYYGYRAKDIEDVRLETFKKHSHLFENKDIFDVGCNDGLITIQLAKLFDAKSVIGCDIDRNLIQNAKKRLKWLKKQGEDCVNTITFQTFDYVLRDERLLALDEERFDIITCLSVTKWIHLNSGDEGLKLAFKRMYKQLRAGGKLILEPQEWSTYKKRSYLTDEIRKNYKNIQLRPNMFQEFLLSAAVGFTSVSTLSVPPENIAKGFQRPIYIFLK